MSSTWWRRNRLWVALLIPTLLLALLASGFRLTTLYWPWEWSRGTSTGTTGTLHQRFLGFDDSHHDRTVDVKVIAVERTPTLDGAAPVDGAVLWRVDLQLTAEPDQLLRGPCHLELVDAEGVRYGVLAGKQPADPGSYWLRPIVAPECVPEGAPGPELEPFSGERVEPEVDRPRTWVHAASVVTPQGVTPERVRIGWTQPEYLELQVP